MFRGVQPGKVPEELHPPYETYAEQYQAEKGELIPSTLDAEIEDIQRLSEQVRSDANQPERLDQFRREALRNSGADTEEKLNNQIDIAREKWVEQRLIDEGLKRAHARGWNDTYTYMKALGEQMIAKTRGDLPTAIIRQSIMESSLEDPEPGVARWCATHGGSAYCRFWKRTFAGFSPAIRIASLILSLLISLLTLF